MQFIYRLRSFFLVKFLIKNKFIAISVKKILNFLNKKITFKLANVNSYKMILDLSEPIQRQMYKGSYEPVQTRWFNSLIKQDDLVVDIGASFGYFTTLASKLKAKVIAFEPSLRASSTIYKTIQFNKIENVELYQYAIGESEGLIEIQIPPNYFESHSPSIIKTPWQNDDWKSTLVPMISLDKFFKSLITRGNEKISMIKIDAEGFEPEIIRGLSGLAKNNLIENIICEFNSNWLERNGSSHQELLELIKSYGFKVSDSTELLTSYEEKDGKFHTLQDFLFEKII
jgi:FkbM family methyltransferase